MSSPPSPHPDPLPRGAREPKEPPLPFEGEGWGEGTEKEFAWRRIPNEFPATSWSRLLAVPLRDVVSLHASSGTTGTPIVFAHTRGDLEFWTEVMARALAAGGVRRDDIVQNSYGYGLFTGGLGFHYGAERVGATVIPFSGGFTERQIMGLRDLGSSVLCCTQLYRVWTIRGVRVVRNTQLYLDLVNYPARGREQAEVVRTSCASPTPSPPSIRRITTKNAFSMLCCWRCRGEGRPDARADNEV